MFSAFPINGHPRGPGGRAKDARRMSTQLDKTTVVRPNAIIGKENVDTIVFQIMVGTDPRFMQ